MRSIDNAVIWSPLEIRLTSTKDYKEPLRENELNAVFVHESGKEILLCGFWFEKNIWAVRFTPILAGKWTYTVEPTDKENEGLFASGELEASVEDTAVEARARGFVTDRYKKRYFTYDDGTPFLWLGDTHWQAPNYETVEECNYPGCNCTNQFKFMIDNRIEKGFNVYQTYFDTGENDGGGQATMMPSLWEKKYVTPSSERYKNKVDKMFEYLHQVGMAAAIGFGVHVHTASVVPKEDLFRFARYIVARYGCYNVMWITAQEITRIKPLREGSEESAMDIYLELGQYISDIDGYDHPNSAHMDVMDVSDERAQRLKNAPWRTFWETQGGHHISMTPKKSHYRDYSLSDNEQTPVIEGELSYEEINCGRFVTNKATRAAAWNTYLNGCAGYTYGVTGIWAQGWSTQGRMGWMGEKSSYSYDPWYMGLDKPGSFEMTYLINFIKSVPEWDKLVPAYYDTALGDFLEDENKLMARLGNDYVLCYFRNEDRTTGKVLALDESKTYTAAWYNVLTGSYRMIATVSGVTEYQIPEKPDNEDWAFALVISLPENAVFEEKLPERAEAEGTPIIPVKVNAIGGMIYRDDMLVDQTPYLTDGDPDTVWMPYSNRSSQTIIFDLGASVELGGIKITPNKDTALPPYRVETSVDGKKWFIQVNTVAEGATRHEAETSDRLTGAWRYVKVILCNAPDIPDEELKDIKVKTFVNDMYFARWNVKWTYTKTEISGITILKK